MSGGWKSRFLNLTLGFAATLAVLVWIDQIWLESPQAVDGSPRAMAQADWSNPP
jgi:hypothetical protein